MEQGLYVVGNGIAFRLPLLRHHIADIQLDGFGFPNSIGNAVHQQIGDNAGIEASGRQHDHVGIQNGLHCRIQRFGMLRQQAYAADAAVLLFLTIENAGFPQHSGPVLKGGLQLDVFIGHRQHTTGDGQYLAQTRHRLVKAGHDIVQRRQQQVAQTLARQRTVCKPVGHQLAHQRLTVGQGLQAVADIAGSSHPQILPQHTGAAAVIRHSNDGGDVAGIQLQTPQQCTQSGSAADAHNFGAVFRRDMI